jgi:zinc transport system substrate-binding protein
MRRSLALVAALFAVFIAGPATAQVPRVVVSVKPIHSLVAAVMEGVGEPALLVRGAASPHVYALRPSDAKHLAEAQLVIWVGPSLESFLVKPLAGLPRTTERLELERAAGIVLLRARAGGTWEEDEHEAPADPLHADGHLWLDPANAEVIAHLAAIRLAALDPADAPRFAANEARLAARLDRLDTRLTTRLAALKGQPFVVFHDAYQYLERRYGLDAIGSVTVSPEIIPGARRLEEIRAKIVSLHARCLFGEPQFEPALLRSIAADTAVATSVLDPEGTALAPGPELYFRLMNGLGDSLEKCLAAPR